MSICEDEELDILRGTTPRSLRPSELRVVIQYNVRLHQEASESRSIFEVSF